MVTPTLLALITSDRRCCLDLDIRDLGFATQVADAGDLFDHAEELLPQAVGVHRCTD
jgi:hypothetical protein